jgi:hypothetical protein
MDAASRVIALLQLGDPVRCVHLVCARVCVSCACACRVVCHVSYRLTRDADLHANRWCCRERREAIGSRRLPASSSCAWIRTSGRCEASAASSRRSG